MEQRLAIINAETGVVENVVVPPRGANVWFVPNGYNAVMAEKVNIGDTYENGVIVPRPMEDAVELEAEPAGRKE